MDRDAKLAPYLASDWDTIDAMLKLAEFRKGEHILDIGAGDGRVLIRALELGAGRAVGVESNKVVYDIGVEHVQSALGEQVRKGEGGESSTDTGKCELLCCDFQQLPRAVLKSTDLIVCFLVPHGLEFVHDWLARCVQEDASRAAPLRPRPMRIATMGWPLPASSSFPLIVASVLPTSGTALYLYRVR